MKVRTLLFLAALFVTVNFSYSFTFDWATNSASNSDGGAITMDNTGNVFITGFGNGEIMVKKYSPTGSFLNSLTITTNAGSGDNIFLEIDANNNLVLVGLFDGATDFQPGIGTYTLTGNSSLFLATYSNDLNSLISAFNLIDGFRPTAIDLGSSSSIYISSVTAISGVQNNAYLTKYNRSDGTILWSFALTVPTIGDIAVHAIDVNDLGELYISGSIYNTNTYPDFDPDAVGTYTAIGGKVFFAKYDTLSNFYWAKGIDISDNQPRTFIKYFNGNVFVASKGNGDIDPGAGIVTANGRFILGQYTASSGSINWGREIHGYAGAATDQEMRTLEIDSTGQVFIGGDFAGDSLDFDVTTASGMFSSTGRVGFIAIYNQTGTFCDGMILPNTSSSVIASVAIVGSEMYIGGYYFGTTDFDPNGTYDLTATINSELFISKYSFINTSGVITQSNAVAISIYPNPTTGKVIITLPNECFELVISDMLGRQIFKALSVQNNIELFIKENGSYNITVRTSRYNLTSKLIVNSNN